MKLNLGCGNDIRHNYMNIDRVAISNLPKEIFQQGDISNLDWLCQDNCVEEILALNILQCFSIDSLPGILQHWHKKLVKDGVIKISVYSLNSLVMDFTNNTIDILDFNRIMFGSNRENLCCIDPQYLMELLKTQGFKINTFKFNGPEFSIEATSNA